MPVAPGPEEGPGLPPAGLDRRFHAFVVDRLVAWALVALAAYVGYLVSWRHGGLWPGLLVLTAAVGLVLVGSVLLLVVRGATPGKALLGLRLVDVATGQPLRPGPALRRCLVLAAAGLPTCGLGAATLAQTAVLDPARCRRGWHDRLVGSIVVDARPREPAEEAVEPAPRQLVNLTAMRLVPVPVATPVATTPTAAAGRPGPSVVAGAAAGLAPPARWRVSFDTGESVLVDGPVLVGRRPAARRDEQVGELVPLASEDLSLSKTHARLHVAADGALVVTDRGSTNGSALVRSGVVRELSAGRPATLLPGDLVRFGDRSMSVGREA